MSITYAFIDTETTGLNEKVQEMFELAIVIKQRDEDSGDFLDKEERIHLMIGPENLGTASQAALDISDFYKRSEAVNLKPRRIVDLIHDETIDRGQRGVATYIVKRLDGASLVGANPAFDARFLEAWLNKFNLSGKWHHRLIDVEAMAMQKFAYLRPKGLQDIAKEVNYDARDAHTAMGDVETTTAVFEALVA